MTYSPRAIAAELQHGVQGGGELEGRGGAGHLDRRQAAVLPDRVRAQRAELRRPSLARLEQRDDDRARGAGVQRDVDEAPVVHLA